LVKSFYTQIIIIIIIYMCIENQLTKVNRRKYETK
jgi:hypothetical protein